MTEIIRETLRTYVTREPRLAPPGAGVFASGRTDTASDGYYLVADVQRWRLTRG